MRRSNEDKMKQRHDYWESIRGQWGTELGSPRRFCSLYTASGKMNITVFISGSLCCSNNGYTWQDLKISVTN